MKRLGAAVAVIALMVPILAVGLTAVAQTSSELHACALVGSADRGGGNGRLGALRLVSGPDDCGPNEQHVSWNVVGPQGAAGPVGPEGPEGPPGPAGDDGIDVAGRSCPDGEFVVGFDDDGGLLCAAPDGSSPGGGDAGGGDPPGDADGDGYTADVDCDDGSADVHPGATESHNGIDDDCDGEIDEIFAVYGSDVGACSTGIRNTETGEIVVPAVGPEPEGMFPDGVDNDCDGQVDDLDCVDEELANTREAARFLGQVSGDTSSGALQFAGSICVADQDWFRFTVREDSSSFFGGEDLTFRVTLEMSGGDLDLYLYDGQGNLLRSSRRPGTTTEVIDWSYDDSLGSDDTRTFFARVAGAGPTTAGTYTLRVLGDTS